jgi:hypothetical protein
MSRLLLLLALTGSALVIADEYVTPSPTPGEVGRFSLFRTPAISIKLDTMTGTTWYLCPSVRKGRQGWCRFKEISGLSPGPIGRFRLTDGAPIILVDTVSGRSWGRCDVPTPEKGEAWCQIDE